MQIQIDGQGITVTPALRELAIKKIERELSHFEKITNVHITLKTESNEHSANANVSIPGIVINAHAQSDDMYKTIDMMVHNLNAQLTKHKEKLKAHRD